MKGWILSIIGIIFLNIMIDVISPEGKTNSFIRSIFVIMFMYVIMTPIIKYIKDFDKIDYSKYFDSTDKVVENKDEINHLIIEKQLKIQEYLTNKGVLGTIVEITGDMSKDEINIKQINVDLSNMVLNIEDKHIDKYRLITRLIMDIVEVSEEQIIYG